MILAATQLYNPQQHGKCPDGPQSISGHFLLLQAFELEDIDELHVRFRKHLHLVEEYKVGEYACCVLKTYLITRIQRLWRLKTKHSKYKRLNAEGKQEKGE